MKTWRDLSILILVALAIWAMFTKWPNQDDRKLNKFSLAQEDKLGEYVFENITSDKQYTLYNNKSLDSVLYIIQSRLVKELDLTEFDYSLYVFDNEMINAFALPGGRILISSGLLEFANSAEEVSAVIAHEMGHVENRHIMKKLIKSLGLSILLSNDQVIFGEISKTITSTTFDRKHESEADDFAFHLLEKSKISPRVVASFFRRLSDEVGAYDERLELFMTHPHNNARIKASIEYPIAKNFEAQSFNIDWDQVKEQLLVKAESAKN